MPVKNSSVSGSTFPKEISDHYEDQGKRLGEGGFAKVILAKHIATGENVALKVMNKEQLRRMGDLHRAYREVEAMKKLCHQHISQLYQVVETDEEIYMVLEYAPGGELFDHIVSKEKLTEKEARRFFRQIVAAVAYIHDKGLAHRDLKPENMLLDHTNNIKLIDFGLSSNPDSGLILPLATCCGSPAYAAPELIAGKEYLGGAADLWSLGVVLYGLLCGFLPFDIDDEEDTLVLYQRIKAGKYDDPEWLSAGSIKLLSKLLETNAVKRIKVSDLLQEEWMKEGYGSPVIWQSLTQTKQSDDSIIEEMAEHYHKPLHYIHDELNEHITAHYHLLKRLRSRLPRPKRITQTSSSNSLPKPILNDSVFQEKPRHIIPATAPRRPRAYTHTTADDNDIYFQDDHKSSPLNDSKSKAFSVFEGLDKVSSPIHEVAMNDKMFQQTKHLLHLGLATPKLARIIRRKVVDMVTPRKLQVNDAPRKVKAIYKVNSTSTRPVEEVRQEISTVLCRLVDTKALSSFDYDSFTFKCKSLDGQGRKLVFELEICSIPGLDDIVGVRHKRLKGDSWSYKKMCEGILKTARI